MPQDPHKVSSLSEPLLWLKLPGAFTNAQILIMYGWQYKLALSQSQRPTEIKFPTVLNAPGSSGGDFD